VTVATKPLHLHRLHLLLKKQRPSICAAVNIAPMALFATAVTTSSKVIAFKTAIYRQGQNSSGPGRFRPGPPSETEKTPALALGFRLLWACFSSVLYRAHCLQVGHALRNGRNPLIKCLVTGRLIHNCRFKRQFNTVPIKKSGRPLQNQKLK
jgi:hypothetical protein